MPILLSDEELDALGGLPDIQYRLYISGIRRYMDYKTGIVGIKRKISYQSLTEEIYVDPKQGTKNGGGRSKDQVKRALKALEKIGLITPQSIVTKTEKRLILKCNFAKMDDSVQNKAALLPPHSAALQAAPLLESENTIKIDLAKHSSKKSRPISRPTQIVKAAAHPVSGLNTTTTTNACAQNAMQGFYNLLSEKRFPLHLLYNEPQTAEMLKAWVDAGVTKDNATTGIETAEKHNGQRPDKPIYYKNFVLAAKRDFDRIQKSEEDPLNANAKTARKSTRADTASCVRAEIQKWAERDTETPAITDDDSAAL